MPAESARTFRCVSLNTGTTIAGEYLCAFLDHGEVEISNNQVENAIRPFVVGRKGWLFSDTPADAEATAIIYSLIETAKANSLRLEDYIEHLKGA